MPRLPLCDCSYNLNKQLVKKLQFLHYVSQYVADAKKDKHARMHEVYSVVKDVRATQGATSSAVDPALAGMPAETFDAGAHLVVTAYSRARVQEELDRLAQMGSRVLSDIKQVGNKWVASCKRPDVPTLSRVESFGGVRIVTGPTREVVAHKVRQLVETGAAVVSDVQCINGVWTAVCEEPGV